MKLSEKIASWRFASLAVVPMLIAALFLSGHAESDNTGVNHNYQTLDDFAEIDRETWKTLPIQYRMPVYETFSTESKKAFWQLKHEELKKLDWTPAELEHIESFYTAVCENPLLMERGAADEELEDRFEVFRYNWREHALDVLGWDRQQLHAVSVSADEVLNTRGELKAYTPVDVNIRLWSAATRSVNNEDCAGCPTQHTNETVLVPHARYCAAFYSCSNGMAIPMWCPPGLVFDAAQQICDWPIDIRYCEYL